MSEEVTTNEIIETKTPFDDNPDYKTISILGGGGFGICYLLKKGDKCFTLKVFDSKVTSVTKIENEIKNLEKANLIIPYKVFDTYAS